MSGQCKACRWWNTAGEYVSDFDGDKTRTCDRIHAAGGLGARKAIIYPVGNGWLSTAATFGCALFEGPPHR